MRIPVTCEGCGKRHEVDEAHAGKRGKCTRCGRAMTVPEVVQAVPPPPVESDDYELGQLPEAAPSTFVSAPGRSSVPPAAERSRSTRAPKPSGPDRAGESARTNTSTTRRSIAIGLVVAAVVIVVLAAILPGATMGVGMVVAIVGLLLALYGYASGAYIAFTEDSLYGMLYLFIPLYTGYYFVSRWDEMRSRLGIVLVGIALLALGGWTMENGLARPQSVERAEAGAGMIVL